MKHAILAAALACAATVPRAAVHAQDWGGSAGVAAMRGYTASSGLSMTSYGAGSAPSPVEAEAAEAPPPAAGPARPVGGLAGDIPHRRPSAGARMGHGHDRRRSRRA